MEFQANQTTLNQFFSARKNSSSFQPTKRRKLETPEVVKIPATTTQVKKATLALSSKKENTPSQPKQRQRKAKIDENTARIVSDDSNQVSLSRKRKASTELLAPQQKARTTQEAPRSQKPAKQNAPTINTSVNEQAKSVLFSRGEQIAGLSTKNDFLKKEVAPPLSALLTPDVESKTAQRRQRSSKLREKYAHLLKPEKSENTIIDQERNMAKPPSTSGSPTKSLTTTQSESKRHELCSKSRHTQPAHQKYKHLAEKIDPRVSSFALPEKFKLLLEMFRCVDSVLYLLNQRKEVCTFARLKKSVQTMSGREFKEEHLQAMKTLYPTGFVFRQEKNLYKLEGGRTSDHQLTIEANFKEASLSNIISSSVLITRRLKFENELVNKVKEAHQKFLRKLNINIDAAEIKRWHPNFRLDSVDDIELSALPQAFVAKTFSTAADLLAKNRGLAPKVESALQKASLASKPSEETKKIEEQHKPATPSSSKRLMNSVSLDLLERIRLKEQRKMKLEMTRDPMTNERLEQVERLPEIARILKAFFTVERKVAITIEDCVRKVTESHGTAIPIGKCEDHIRLLAELVPHAVTIATVRKCLYVKLARNLDLADVTNVLKIKKEEMQS